MRETDDLVALQIARPDLFGLNPAAGVRITTSEIERLEERVRTLKRLRRSYTARSKEDQRAILEGGFATHGGRASIPVQHVVTPADECQPPPLEQPVQPYAEPKIMTDDEHDELMTELFAEFGNKRNP